MTEATLDGNHATEIAALQDAAREFERARLRQIGGFHFAMVIGSLTMWGSAEAWWQVTHWSIAGFAALAGALVAGFVIPSTIHEWGHFSGARMSGAKSPVLDRARRHFFMFDFPIEENDKHQFVWMSWGGILAPWGVVALAAIFVPLSLTSGAALFATLVARAVAISVFEVPIARAVERGGDPSVELKTRVTAGGLAKGRKFGNITGFALFAVLWIVA